MISLYNIQVAEADTITEPVELDDAKDWLKVENIEEDDLITAMITAARQDIENYCNIKLVDSSGSFYVKYSGDEDLELPVFPYAPVIPSTVTVNSIVNGQANEELVVDEDYYLNGVLTLGTGRYLVEYDITAASVPETLKEAIKMLVAYRYEHRGDNQRDDQLGLPEDVLSKIARYRQQWL